MCLVRSGEQILFVQQAYGLHLWTFPGGTVEPGEGYMQAAVRELREETGLQGVVTGLCCFRSRGNQTIAVFDVQVIGGQLLETVPGEIEATAWFTLDALESQRIELFSGLVARRSFENRQTVLCYEPWTGGSGDADLFI
jgi:ADP-ribose pyrophosphatase YjhB (NUDIX family)